MGVVDGTVRRVGEAVGRAATATTAAAGAVGGAAVNGVVGGVTGTVTGVQRGVSAGSHSMLAAVLTLGALGASGLVEWPLVLGVGGGALVLRQLNRQPEAPAKATQAETTAPSNPRRPAQTKQATARQSRSSQARSKPSSRA